MRPFVLPVAPARLAALSSERIYGRAAPRSLPRAREALEPPATSQPATALLAGESRSGCGGGVGSGLHRQPPLSRQRGCSSG